MFKINDQTQHMISEKYRNYLLDLYGYMKSKLNFPKDISSLNLLSNSENSKNPLGNTAFYEPSRMSVSIYCDNRHIKDIMRSFAHELIHHNQNCDSKLSNISLEDGYAQDEKYRSLEEDAYLNGNLHFRDWEDSHKKQTLDEENMRDKLKKVILEALTEECSMGGGGMGMQVAGKPPKRKKKKAFMEAELSDFDYDPEWFEQDSISHEVHRIMEKLIAMVHGKEEAESLYMALKQATESAKDLYNSYIDPDAAEDTHKVRHSQNLEKIKRKKF